MIVEIATAIGLTIGLMILVGTIVRGFLNLRSIINWLVQTAVLLAAAVVLSVTTVQLVIMALGPAVIHLLFYGTKMFVNWRAARGDYGETVRWQYELFDEGDEEFIRAQINLPGDEIMEAEIVSDSKEELRERIVDRYEDQ